MDAIESLKSKNKEEESVDSAGESSEEIDNSDNETGTELPEEESGVKECAEKSPTKCKPGRSPKRQNVNVGKRLTED